MEITFAWYWIITYSIAIIGTFFGYIGLIKKRKLLCWQSVIFYIFIILNIIKPIKIDGTNLSESLRVQNKTIESQKTLPPKVIDDSFKKGDNEVKSITTEEIWN